MMALKKLELSGRRVLFSYLLLTITLLIFCVAQFFDARHKDTKIEDIFGNQEILHNGLENELPDVFHIITDMYLPNTILKSKLNFDNSLFIDQLKEKNFVEIEGRSNYVRTAQSIASITNLNYINHLNDDELDYVINSPKSIKNTLEGRIAMDLGYTVKHISSNDIYFGDHILLGDFVRLLVENSILKIIYDINPKIQGLWKSRKSRDIDKSFSSLIEISEESDHTWTFFYISLPHPPFIFDANGSRRSTNEMNQDFERGVWTEKTKDLYINQIKILNNLLISATNKILENSNENTVIIIQSDDGVHQLSGNMGDLELEDTSLETIEEAFAINVFLKTGAQCSEFNSTDITNVNIIRTLLNICFKQTVEDVRDKYFWSSSHNKNFIEINLDEIKP